MTRGLRNRKTMARTLPEETADQVTATRPRPAPRLCWTPGGINAGEGAP